jgi:hypothetical protein
MVQAIPLGLKTKEKPPGGCPGARLGSTGQLGYRNTAVASLEQTDAPCSQTLKT